MKQSKEQNYSYLITVVYDGSGFAGWARQPNQFTVQEYIENNLSKIFQHKISILAASRTDKGVHAYDQNFTLRISLSFSEGKLLNLLKRTLSQILVKRVKKVNAKFHPIKSVISKEYRYFINTGNYNVFQKKYCWEYNSEIKIRKLKKILLVFQGQYDFFNFSYCRWKDKEKTNTKREIIALNCWKENKIMVISIVAKSFLRYQIRAMIGEAINCYEDKCSIQDLKNKLVNPHKMNYKYKKIAPASGLYLWNIRYNFNTER